MNDHARFRHPATLLGLLLLTGCGGLDYQTAAISGRITLDGRPLANAHVYFQPIAQGNPNPGPGSSGLTDADGRFQLQLQTVGSRKNVAVVGPCTVRISLPRPNEGRDTDAGSPRDTFLPPQADDGSLRFEVPVGGTQAANFALVSQSQPRLR